MKIPRLDVDAGTFAKNLWERFSNRYGEVRAQKLLTALSRPVREFAVRVTLTKATRKEIAEFFEKNSWKASPHPLLEEMILIQTKGPRALPYLPATPRITCDKIAAENVFIGANLFWPGVQKVPKLRKEEQVSITSPLDQIVAIGISNMHSGERKTSGIAIRTIQSFYEVPSLRKLGFHGSGKVYSQSLPAAYVAHVLNPKPREVIVDLCAAPGGKATSAAILTRDKAKIIAFDRSKKRIKKMQQLIKQQQLTSIRIIRANSIEYFKSHNIRADKVIVDPSCSAIGVRPKMYEKTTDKEIISVSKYQKSFLWVAEKILRKGGTITYSTCTLEPEENEKVIAYAVQELGLKEIEPELVMGTKGEDTGDGLELESMRRFYPDQFDTPGFFVAKLVK
ncbi:MAG: methyltransferase domain-containing protein [Candidatus Heimdallarchaeota archaeon]|nr:methyltransferase domain-containing protein [Candidatus Heimdallarchaeota archaeon]